MLLEDLLLPPAVLILVRTRRPHARVDQTAQPIALEYPTADVTQVRSQHTAHGVAHRNCGGSTAEIGGAQSEPADGRVVEDGFYRGFDGGGFGFHGEAVAQHERGGEDLGYGIDDAAAGYVGGGSVDLDFVVMVSA